jgi:hypothetical protein
VEKPELENYYEKVRKRKWVVVGYLKNPGTAPGIGSNIFVP